jgi:hypothetical protein
MSRRKAIDQAEKQRIKAEAADKKRKEEKRAALAWAEAQRAKPIIDVSAIDLTGVLEAAEALLEKHQQAESFCNEYWEADFATASGLVNDVSAALQNLENRLASTGVRGGIPRSVGDRGAERLAGLSLIDSGVCRLVAQLREREQGRLIGGKSKKRRKGANGVASEAEATCGQPTMPELFLSLTFPFHFDPAAIQQIAIGLKRLRGRATAEDGGTASASFAAGRKCREVAKLNPTKRRILSLCRRKALPATAIARKLELSSDHTRRVLAEMMRAGLLSNGLEGYRTRRAT